MEQKRRTISSNRKRGSAKKFWTVVGIILGLALIFYVSYRLSYGLFSSDNDGAETTQSTQEDIANMSREELENKYMELQDKLAEKDKEIDMLTERLEKGNDSKPETDSKPEDKNEESIIDSEPQTKPDTSSESSRPSQSAEQHSQTAPSTPSTPEANTPPPAAPFEPSSELISPEDLAAMEQATRQ